MSVAAIKHLLGYTVAEEDERWDSENGMKTVVPRGRANALESW